MNKNSKIFNVYFILFLCFILFMVWQTSSKMTKNEYTMGAFTADLESGKIAQIVIEPNKEVPTGVLNVLLISGEQKSLNVTDSFDRS